MLTVHVKLSPEEKARQLEDYVRQAEDGLAVYRYFLQTNRPVKLGLKYRSPLPGHVDKHPSFNMFRSTRDGMIWWKDHAVEGGNVWKFIQLMTGCDFGDAVRFMRVNILNLPERDDPASVVFNQAAPLVTALEKKAHQIAPALIFPYLRAEPFYQGQYAAVDEAYYPAHLFGAELLATYRVMPLSSYRFVREDPDDPKDFTVSGSVAQPMYYYQFMGYDEQGQWVARHKIVRPKSDYKWLSNTKANLDIFGSHLWQPPAEGQKLPVLVLLAGQRDTMAFHKLTGLPAGCFSAEGHYPTEQQLALLGDLFETIFVLYDNDKTGRENQAILTGQAPPAWLADHAEKPLYSFYGGLDALLHHYDTDGSQKLDVTKLLLSRPAAEHAQLASWWRSAVGLPSH